MSSIEYEKLIGKKTLIVGPLGSGKTKLLANILEKFHEMKLERDIVVLDFAPRRVDSIGGKLSEYIDVDRFTYLSPKAVRMPRYEGKGSIDVIFLAEENRVVMEFLLKEAMKLEKRILVINDVTLYLHLGNLQRLIELILSRDTVVITAYYGQEFDDKSSGINIRERSCVEELMRFFDYVIRLGGGE